MSFFADTGKDEFEMHRARAAGNVLGIRLRDILREELGGTYGVSVGYENTLPLPGYGAMIVQFGSAPENMREADQGGVHGSRAPQGAGPDRPTMWPRCRSWRRRDLETNARQNPFWLGSLQTVHMLGWDPIGITRRPQRTDSADAGDAARDVQEVLPDGSLHRRDAEAGALTA